MSRKHAHVERVDYAIKRALVRAGEPLRYNELHRKANSILGHRIWIKTFDAHLKKLVKTSMVIREEKNRYYVTYKLEKKQIDAYVNERASELLDRIEQLMEVPGVKEEFEHLADKLEVLIDQVLRKQGLGHIK